MDCNVKLIQKLFPDSKICQSLQCGRTKMEAIAKNILSPLSIEKHLKAVNSRKFSIASDASNEGNIKLFPIAIQYFDINSGINIFVIDFYEDPNETSNAIYNRLKMCLNEYNLDLNNLIAFSGDNASVNYGKYHSIFQSFKENNKFIVKANCNCHILLNTIKYALIKCLLVSKISFSKSIHIFQYLLKE